MSLEYVVPGGSHGMASIGYFREAGGDHDGRLVTCGASATLIVHSSCPTTEPLHKITLPAPLHCLAINPAGTQVAVADDSHFVKLYKLPGLEEVDVATRFTLPVRAVAFSLDGSKLAAAGDDAGIKLVNMADTKVLRTLRAGPYTRSLAFDPDGEFIASVSADGSLQVWHTGGKAELRLPKAAPKVDTASVARSLPAWHPDGSLLAVPGCDNDVTVYERLSWEPTFSLAGQHSAPVNAVRFSPDGLHVVTAGQDRLLVLWSMAQKSVVATRSAPDVVSDMAWQAEANTLACITESGGVVLWADILPEAALSPAAGKGSEDGRASSQLDVSKDADLGDFIERDTPELDKCAERMLGGVQGSDHRQLAAQGAIQPGATPAGESKRRWLAFSLLGCISSLVEDGQSVIEVAFHDVISHKRVPLFTDFRDFCMASLGPKGALYASAAAPRSPSMVVYRPFESWAAGGDWAYALPASGSAVCTAAGRRFCAIATSDRLLRVFTLHGVQVSITSLPGAPLALALQNDALAAVWHAGAPAGDGSQTLDFAVYELTSQAQVAFGHLPLSAGARLVWLGFGEDGELAAYDTAGVMRMQSGDTGNMWVPVFSAAADGKPGEVYWPVGVAGGELVCAICSAAAQHPKVIPRPALSRMALRAPVLSTGDEAVVDLEADMLRRNITLSHLQKSRSCYAGSEERLAAEEAQADRTLLRLFQAALKAEKLGRALDLAACLALPQSLEGALRLARHHRAPALVERLQVLQQQSQPEAAEDAPSEAAAHAEAHVCSGDGAMYTSSPGLAQPSRPVPTSPVRPHGAAALGPSAKANLPALHGACGDGLASKRKASAANPFARKSKAPKSLNS